VTPVALLKLRRHNRKEEITSTNRELRERRRLVVKLDDTHLAHRVLFELCEWPIVAVHLIVIVVRPPWQHLPDREE